MPDAEDEDQESKQKPPRVEEAQSEQDGDRGPGQVELAAPEERPRDVAPVQLPCRQEIDRGHEEPDPAREGERVRMGEERLRKREEQREAAEQERRLRLPREREAGRRGGGRYASPAKVTGIAIAKPTSGPDTPMSRSARRFGIGSRMLMNAPNVPRGGTDGKKNGRDAWTLYRFATR